MRAARPFGGIGRPRRAVLVCQALNSCEYALGAPRGDVAPGYVMTFRHPAERSGQRRGWFARLAEQGSNFTSSPLFFSACFVLVAIAIAVHLADVPLKWQIAAGDAMTAVTLLLLALLKNAERRAELAVQRKLDAIAAALLDRWQGEHTQARQLLEKVIGMEEGL
jgi:low affinity Fe/Cu permease